MSSKWSLLGSEGRMRISWVIRQRRLPRRSVLEIGCFGELPVGSFFVIKSCWVAMGNYLSGQLLHTIREECKPSATTKPIAETYLEGSSTSHQNGSTEVLQKERSGLCKTTGNRPLYSGRTSGTGFRHFERM